MPQLKGFIEEEIAPASSENHDPSLTRPMPGMQSRQLWKKMKLKDNQ